MSTKIHLATRGLGLPVRLTLTAGQRGDITEAHALIDGLPARYVLADTAGAFLGSAKPDPGGRR